MNYLGSLFAVFSIAFFAILKWRGASTWKADLLAGAFFLIAQGAVVLLLLSAGDQPTPNARTVSMEHHH